jgi:hypothetical protein
MLYGRKPRRLNSSSETVIYSNDVLNRRKIERRGGKEDNKETGKEES